MVAEQEALLDAVEDDQLSGVSPNDLLIYSDNPDLVAVRCSGCGGTGFRIKRGPRNLCPAGCDECQGVGWKGIDATIPTNFRAGTPGKVAVIAARYAAGKPLWLKGDYDAQERIPGFGPQHPEAGSQFLIGDFEDSFADD